MSVYHMHQQFRLRQKADWLAQQAVKVLDNFYHVSSIGGPEAWQLHLDNCSPGYLGSITVQDYTGSVPHGESCRCLNGIKYLHRAYVQAGCLDTMDFRQGIYPMEVIGDVCFVKVVGTTYVNGYPMAYSHIFQIRLKRNGNGAYIHHLDICRRNIPKEMLAPPPPPFSITSTPEVINHAQEAAFSPQPAMEPQLTPRLASSLNSRNKQDLVLEEPLVRALSVDEPMITPWLEEMQAKVTKPELAAPLQKAKRGKGKKVPVFSLSLPRLSK